MAEHFDAIVVGSGFGGSVPAYRLAEAGMSVCVLERGRAWPPGSFARSPREMSRNTWDPSAGLYGLFDLWTFDGIEAVVSSGLGGGSLIYANVLIRKPERWFVDEEPGDRLRPWPVQRDDLEPHYDRAEEMLGAEKFPFGEPGYEGVVKTREFKEAAERAGFDWYLPNLAVAFRDASGKPVTGAPIPGDNLHGLPRSTCRLCGECDVGCNYGSKNTLDYTYLTAAEGEGAEIRPLCEVRRFKPRDEGDGYRVTWVRHDPSSARPDRARMQRHEATCRVLVVAAGTLGTNFLMLHNRDRLPGLSPALGRRFCGNGDLLTFCVRAKLADGSPRPLDPSHGPVITSTLRVPDALDPGGSGRGFFIQDAGYPEFANWLVETARLPAVVWRTVKFAVDLIARRLRRSTDSDLDAEVSRLLGDARLSWSSMPLLGMGRDTPDGRFSLRQGRLANDWTMHSSRAYFKRVRETMARIAGELDARLLDNPLWWLKRVVTVHPVGGCAMSERPEHGVVDEHGEVHGHPGFFITDGSVMPGPVGPNPALTIAAFADRAADRIIDRYGGAPSGGHGEGAT